MRFLIVLAMLAAVALANPLINIRVNVDSQTGLPPGPGPYPPPGPGPYPPPGPNPEEPPPQPYRKDALEPAALPADSDVIYPINEAVAPLVNIEVFVDNQRQGNIPIVPEYPPPPQPY
ncbi:uncharacterized protein LOC128299133 [Anopheles moucheti]|uniref:uncharacterized protein LOC128299133 n=1 Tax=Anopheles moucheti TaxID=186751 RepID=UPI0022F07573|nr:uncharacterized protein LOC128299133 [Anopheles moucheti]